MITAIKNILYACAALLCLASCNKDLGNYNYVEINQVDSVEALRDTTVLFGKNLRIQPVIHFSLDANPDTSNYSYEWLYFYKTSTGSNDKRVISTHKDLAINISMPAGVYPFHYGITDKRTGIQQRFPFNLTVVNAINEGWFLLSEVDGKSRLDVVAKQINGSYSVVTDLFKSIQSDFELKGKPKYVYAYSTGNMSGLGANFTYGLYALTDQNSYRFNPENYEWKENYTLKNEVLGNIPNDFTADLIKQSGSAGRSYMISQGDVYLYHGAQSVRYSTPLNYISLSNRFFKIAPFVATSEGNGAQLPAIFYDINNKQFVKHSAISSSCTEIPDPEDENKLFSFKTNKDLRYMDWVPNNGGEVYSILKEASSGKVFLARFNLENNKQKSYEEISIPTFVHAEQYAVSPVHDYIFYSVKGKVYQYNVSLKTSKLMQDYGDKQVSLLKFHNFHNKGKYVDSDKLIVCAYDPNPADPNSGTMDIFEVPTLSNDLIPLHHFTGFGNVISLTYRER